MKYDFDIVHNRYGSYCTQWDYTKDRFGSDDVLPFSISDMDFALPSDFIKYLQDELASGIYGYTRWRNEYLLGSIINWYQKRFNYVIKDTEIIYSPTVIFSLAELIRLKTAVNDAVMLLTPSYDAFFKVIKDNNRKLITSELRKVEDSYYLDYSNFEQQISKVKVLVLCSPHNPVGKVWSRDELEYIIKTCKKYNVFIISDEIHMDITFKQKHIPIYEVADLCDYQNGVCIITSATKAFNFPGLLFSYAVIKDKKLYDDFEIALKNKNGLSSCTILGMKATAYAYNHLDEYIDQLNDYIYHNYEYVVSFLKQHQIEIIPVNLEGTYLLWLDANAYDINKLLKIMYEQTKLGIMSGEIYGVEGFLRINIGCPLTKVVECMERLLKTIKIYEEKYEG